MIIGIGGVAESGKDAIADILVAEHGFVKTYMSKPLEQALLTLNPLVHIQDNLWIDWFAYADVTPTLAQFCRYQDLHAAVGYDESKKCNEVRRLLQVLGTEIGRNMFHENCWVDIIIREINAYEDAGKDVVIAGIRYENEFNTMKYYFMGELWWVERPGFAPINSHSSDNSLDADDFDMVIKNHGTLADLSLAVTFALEGMREK